MSASDNVEFLAGLNPELLRMILQLERELGDRPPATAPPPPPHPHFSAFAYHSGPPFTHVNPADVFPPEPVFYFEPIAAGVVSALTPAQASTTTTTTTASPASPAEQQPGRVTPPQSAENPKVPRTTAKTCAQHKGQKPTKKTIELCEACKVGRNTCAYIEAFNPNRKKGYCVWEGPIKKGDQVQGGKRQRKAGTCIKASAERDWFVALLDTPGGMEYIQSILPPATFAKLKYTHEQRVLNNVALPDRYVFGF